MLQINTMRTAYRLAGGSAERAQLARRLDRVVTDRLGDVLDVLLGELAHEDGPVYRIRRVNLSLWLNAGRLDDAAISRRWAEAMARALHRQIIDGSADLLRYESQADYLASWVIDLMHGRCLGQWQYDEFAIVHDQPVGRAVTHTLSRHPEWILPTLEQIRVRRQLTRLVATFDFRDVERIWHALTGSGVDAVGPLPAALLARLHGVVAPGEPEQLEDSDGRARRALHWLLAFTAAPVSLAPAVAARAALAMTAVEAVAIAVPGIVAELRRGPRGDDIVELLARAPNGLDRQVQWMSELLKSQTGRDTLVALVEAQAVASHAGTDTVADAERRASDYAGLALLLPALRHSGLEAQLGDVGRRDLLAAVFDGADRALAASDPVLRWFAGLPDHPSIEPTIEWPSAAELGIDASTAQADDAGPLTPALLLVLHRFSDGLRSMPGSSRSYLRSQFFRQRGFVTRTDETLRVQLQGVPLRTLLRLGGRLGDQGLIDWIDRRLIIEVSDG